jgi:aryl sulfotransferase
VRPRAREYSKNGVRRDVGAQISVGGEMSDQPKVDYTYRNFLMDSGRWAGFRPRAGDVFVCTSYKAGTTWTQMICALLIHQDPKLPAPLGELSPWMEMQVSPVAEVHARLDAQRHRRFIKTHTALDGLPYFEDVTYLVCGRDPRDVFMSMQHHMTNLDMERAAMLLAQNGAPLDGPPREPPPDDFNVRFHAWMTQGTFDWESDGFPHWSHFHHGETFWAHRHLPNIHFLHYSDLKADLEGEMRRLAEVLGIEIDAAKWPALVKAATFDEMKANADRISPNSQQGLWRSNSEFFHNGRNAQWRGVLSDESLALYEDVKRERYDPTYTAWMEQGSRAMGDPKTL